MKAIAVTLLTASFGAAFATTADAQPAYAAPVQRGADAQTFALVGAGGRGGSGAGAVGEPVLASASVSRCGVAYENRVSDYTSHVRSSAPPPMDPCRKVEIVECRRPFDAFKGNILCR